MLSAHGRKAMSRLLVAIRVSGHGLRTLSRQFWPICPLKSIAVLDQEGQDFNHRMCPGRLGGAPIENPHINAPLEGSRRRLFLV